MTDTSSVTQDTNTPDEIVTGLKVFSANEFHELFNGLLLPNTIPIINSPEITGDVNADEYISNLAEKRGYSLRSIPSSDLATYQGIKLQKLLIADWKELAEAAKKDGFNIKIRSGYRSISSQRRLFVEQLSTLGLSNSEIASGNFEQAISDILKFVAPPGYSRHHHGYTIDVYDPEVAVFEYSPVYSWIKANNFENAKIHGFIPSYPEGVDNQGPDPEPWEFVWANREFVLE
jgi:D-alanyl-D-alanine carboxypeptidase